MSDRYQQFARSAVGSFLVHRLGLPDPPVLRRYQHREPALPGPAVLGSTPGSRLVAVIRAVAIDAGIELVAPIDTEVPHHGALIFDATGITRLAHLRELYEFFQPRIRQLAGCARIVVLGTAPEHTSDTEELIVQRALEGFTRSVGKELKRGSTAQLVYVAPSKEPSIASTLRFLLSAKSAYISGQVIRIGNQASATTEPASWLTPLAGKVALVTGAARGIGAAIAEVLARDGARVIALDIPAHTTELSTVASRIEGAALPLDVTDSAAPAELVEYFKQQHGGVDIVVHNAGITRDKTLSKMTASQWDSVLTVNVASQLNINNALLEMNLLRTGGRIIGVSSVSGIAGNRGQTNYATSKAGVIGMVQALAPVVAERNATINAVAPGFIETTMTTTMPLLVREVGRRMNSMRQGGLPVDVAETVAWYANPASGAINGNIIRVCGQSWLGA